MADKKVTDLTEITDVADNDWHYLIDVSDTSEDAAGTGKKVQQSNVVDKLEALKLRLTADGSITAGQAVEFLEGKLKAGGGDNITQAAETTASTDDGSLISACVLSDSSFAIVFIDTSGTLQCVIGTISGTTISYGTQVQADSATSCSVPSVCALSSTKIAIGYVITGAGKCIIATVSGTVPTFGSSVTFKSATIDKTNVVALSASLLAISYADGTNNLTQIIAATVSGTVPTFGSALSLTTANTINFLVKMSSTAIVGFTSVTPLAGFYFIVNYSSSTLTLLKLFPALPRTLISSSNTFSKLNSDTIIQIFRGWDSFAYAQLLTFNGYDLQVTDPVRISTLVLSDTAISITRLDDNRAVAFYNVNSTAIAHLLEIQNSTINATQNMATVSGAAGAGFPFIISPKSDKAIPIYVRSADIKSRLIQVSKFVGIAATTVADAATAVAVVRGVSSAHSGLTTGALYYTNSAGTISTDDSGRLLGVAVSSTKILLQNSLDRAGAYRSDLIDSIPVAYTPTFTGFGTVSGVSFYSWKVGSLLFVRGLFTTGTVTATEARISLGFKGVNNAVTSLSSIGTLEFSGNLLLGTTSVVLYVLMEASKTYVTFGRNNASSYNPLSKIQGADFASSTTISVNFCVPISGW